MFTFLFVICAKRHSVITWCNRGTRTGNWTAHEIYAVIADSAISGYAETRDGSSDAWRGCNWTDCCEDERECVANRSPD